ncbi:hypothetical protein L9F63_025831, partial [Diploptera punctata]
MANLGYFQLKANPGAWLLRLRQGRSADIFDIVSHDGSDTPANSTDIKVLISSFRSHVLKLKVAKKPDKMHMDLLADDADPNSGIWNSITSFGAYLHQSPQYRRTIFSIVSCFHDCQILLTMEKMHRGTSKHLYQFWIHRQHLFLPNKGLLTAALHDIITNTGVTICFHFIQQASQNPQNHSRCPS